MDLVVTECPFPFQLSLIIYLSDAKTLAFVHLTSILAYFSINRYLFVAVIQLFICPHLIEGWYKPPMNIIYIELWLSIFKLFALIHELVNTYTFDATDVKIEAGVVVLEEIDLIRFRFDLL